LDRFFVSLWHAKRWDFLWTEKPHGFMFWAMRDLRKWHGIAAIGQNEDIYSLKNMVDPGIQQLFWHHK